MGKQSKKKGNTSKKGKKNAGGSKGSQQQPSAKATQSKRDSDQTTLYRIYKYCTEAVIQWGRSNFKSKGKQVKKNSTSLSHVIFDILGSLASDGVLMPEPVLDDLKLAISYRKKVGQMYRSLPQVSEDDNRRHEWLIEQMELLLHAFRRNAHSKQSAGHDVLDGDVAGTRVGFEALAVSDDEESVASEGSGDGETGGHRKQKILPLKTPPTPEELEAEERLFAISLLMCEIDEVRRKLKNQWKEWAKARPQTDEEAGQSLFAVTACTEYAIAAVRKSVIQVSVEIGSFDAIDQIMTDMNVWSAKSGSKELGAENGVFKEGDHVTLCSLEKRPDLNGRHGVVCGKVNGLGERIPVQLFPMDKYETRDKKEKISIKPENLLTSDNTYFRLCQITSALKSCRLTNNIPTPPALFVGAPASSEVQQAGLSLILKAHSLQNAAKNQDLHSMLELTIQYVLPLWLSMAKYVPDAGAAAAVLVSYLQDFEKSREIKFPLVFAILVALDGALASAAESEDNESSAKDLFVRVLNGAFDRSVYKQGIEVLVSAGRKPDALYSHMDIVWHLLNEYSVVGMFYPFMSGEILLSGLRMHFVCGSGLPYAFVDSLTHVLHIYWMLRSEKYLGRIPDLESMLRMYRQNVFFRGGLAKRGTESYLKCQQLAQGVSASAMRYLDGKETARRTGKAPSNNAALGMDGLHVSEISRLLDILQWKTMPFVEKDACFREIETIAKEEYLTVFTAPLLSVSVKLARLANWLEAAAPAARSSGELMMDNFSLHTSRMTPIDLVSFWAMCLGDDRSIVPGEKDERLIRLAGQFRTVFSNGVEPINDEEEPTLLFSANEHEVNSALWGVKGALREEYRQI